MSKRVCARFKATRTGISEDDLDDPEQTTRLFSALVRLTDQLRNVELPFGLTAEELIFLGHVRARSRCALDDLKHCIPVGAISPMDMAEKLERRGFLKSSRETFNGRRLILSATQRGLEAFESALQKYFVHVLGTLSRLDESQRSAIEELFSEIRLNDERI